MGLLTNAIHISSKLDEAVLDSLADFICGDDNERFPEYRSSSYLTRFFQVTGLNVHHDGSTRKWWTLEVLRSAHPHELEKIILRLVDLKEYKGNRQKLKQAVLSMRDILVMEDLSIDFEGTTPIIVRAKPLNFEDADFMPNTDTEESEFLGKQFSDDLRILELGFDSVITQYLQERIDEIQASPKYKTPLATIFLLGSTLEGILLATALKDEPVFMNAHCAPKNKSGNVLKVHEWRLQSLIDAAFELKLIGQDVKKFSHILRDFRNYIHPYKQMSHDFHPDQHTVDICWQVFKAAFEQLKNNGSVSNTTKPI